MGVSATDMSPAVRPLSCFAPAPRVLQAMSSDPLPTMLSLFDPF